jgi:hypothetical protein
MSSIRTIIDTEDGKVTRSRVKENDGDGEYRPFKRPLRQGDLINLRAGERVARLHARGVTDEADIIAVVNTPRATRRSAPKKPSTEEAGAPEKLRPRLRAPGRPRNPRRRR